MPVTLNGKDVVTAIEALGDVLLSYQAAAALTAGNRQITVPLAGVKAGDVLSARPLTAIPVGYDIGAAYCATDGQLVVIVNHPALVVLQTFSVNVRSSGLWPKENHHVHYDG